MPKSQQSETLANVRTELLTKQDWKCAVCKRDFRTSFNASGTPLVACVDHDHKTGRVRGVLCAGCNGAEGRIQNLLKRSIRGVHVPSVLRALADYLEQDQTEHMYDRLTKSKSTKAKPSRLDTLLTSYSPKNSRQIHK